jgi:hypothetical protein
MRRPVKLNFKPLSLKETAKELGIPRARALKIMALFGVPTDGLRARRGTKGKVRARQKLSRSSKASR